MADSKISALTAITGANVETSTDVLAIVDTDAGATKKILIDELANALKATQAEVNAMSSTNTLLTPNLNKIVVGTLNTTTGGTEIDFGSIPSGVRKITISVNGLSLSGTSNIMIRLGDSGGIENSGYAGSSANISAGTAGGPTAFSAGFILSAGSTAAAAHYAQATLVLINSATFAWSYSGIDGSDVPTTTFGAGTKSLSAELTQVRITTVNGSDTFDANGGVNIAYER